MQADYKIIFVDAIVPVANVLQGDDEAVGFNVQGSNVAVVSTYNLQNGQGAPLPVAETEVIAAHELGHAMGLNGASLPRTVERS